MNKSLPVSAGYTQQTVIPTGAERSGAKWRDLLFTLRPLENLKFKPKALFFACEVIGALLHEVPLGNPVR